MSEVSETPRGRLVPLLQNFCVFIMIVGSLNWGVTGIRMTMDAELDACAMHDGKSMVVDLLEPIGSQIFSLIIYYAVFVCSIIYILTIIPNLMRCRCLPTVEFVEAA
jgi:uncharacterized membrane protein YuzA (DUF378 family)|tara:strand:- start:1412 stop:1732 length:321 start_codon:yes stop_codon:yes gene_type:complete